MKTSLLSFRATLLLAFLSVTVMAVTTSGAAAQTIASKSTAQQDSDDPPAVGSKAPDFSLETLDNKTIKLSELTAEGPVVLLVLRGWPGYQCPICNRQVGQYISKAKDFAAANAKIVMVYPGPADQLKDHAQEFISGKTLPENAFFVTDPDYTFTNAYHLRWEADRETAYPSTFLIVADNEVRFAKISKTHGDRTKPEDVLKELPQK